MPAAIITIALFVLLSLVLFWSAATIGSSEHSEPARVMTPTPAMPVATP